MGKRIADLGKDNFFGRGTITGTGYSCMMGDQYESDTVNTRKMEKTDRKALRKLGIKSYI